MTEAEAKHRPPLRMLGKHSLRAALFLLPLVAIANIAFLIWSLDGRSLLDVAVAPHWLALALLFSFVPWVTNCLRLAIWSKFFELDLGPAQIFRIILGTVLGNAVTPTATGAPVVKWAFLVNEKVTPGKATTLIGIQTAEDSAVSLSLLAAAIVAAVMLDIPALFPSIDWIGAAAELFTKIILTLLAALLLIGPGLACALTGLLGKTMQNCATKLSRRLREIISNAAKDWKYAFKAGRKYLLASTALGVLQWTTRHSIAALVIGFVGGQMMPMLHWVLQWLTITASSIIPSPGGAGGTEASFLLFFAPFVSSDLLGLTMVIWRATIFYVPVIIAACLFISLRWHQPIGRETRD